jgi:hypothetical protein
VNAPHISAASTTPAISTIRAQGAREHGRIVRRKAARALVGAQLRARRRIDDELAEQRGRDQREHRTQDEEHRAPAKPIADDPARRLTEQLPGNLAGR